MMSKYEVVMIRDKKSCNREREDNGGKCQFILTLDITTVKWES